MKNQPKRLALGGVFVSGLLIFGFCLQNTLPGQVVHDSVTIAIERPSRVDIVRGMQLFSAARILEHQNIEPTVEGVRDFLQKMHPDHAHQLELARQAGRWIDQLADDRYSVRRSAKRELSKMPRLPLADLKAASQSDNPEVASSAKAILAKARSRPVQDSLPGITRAICETISKDELIGLAAELLVVIDLFDDRLTIKSIHDAMTVTCRSGDMPVLMEALKVGAPETRQAALIGIVSVQRIECRDLLIGLLEDSDESIQVYAAKALANMGERNSLACLIDLMRSEDIGVRIESNRVLKSATRMKFGFFAFEPPESRNQAIERWQEWLANHGSSIEIQIPLIDVDFEIGRILVSDYSSGRVVELDVEGNVTWETALSNPWAVQGLSNGHRIVGLYNPSAIVEFDAAGKQVWRVEDVPGNVMGVDRLENGHTLAACSSAEMIVEYDQEGNVVWKAEVAGRPTDVQHLDNDNILVTLMTPALVVEIDREGKTVWELSTDVNPLHAQKTAAGTILVTTNNSGVAIEYDLQGEEVNRIELPEKCTAGRRLANGDTVVATEGSIRLLDPDGEVKWEYTELSYCYGVYPF